MAKRKKKTEPEADVLVLEAPAVEAPPVPRMDVSDRGDADQARRVTGVLVKPTDRWPFSIRMVALGSPKMKAFREKAKRTAVGIANAERIQSGPEKVPAIDRFEHIPAELQNIARCKWVLECLRGGGTGVYAWRGSDPGELDLRGSTTEEVREAFARSFKALDLEVSTDLLDDLEGAADRIDRIADEVVLEAEKKSTDCGVPPRPAKPGSGLLGSLLGGDAGSSVDPMALLAMLAKSKAAMAAATPKAQESPTG